MLEVAVSKEKREAAVASKDGMLYTFSLEESRNFCQLVPAFLKRKLTAVTSLEWNAENGCLFAATGGSVAMFKRS